MGMFASPNASSIMNGVAPVECGVASGMRATFQNAGVMMSTAVLFTIVISSLSGKLPSALATGQVRVRLPRAEAAAFAHLSPMSVLFSALLGFNPLARLLSAGLRRLPPATQRPLLGKAFFAHPVASPFLSSLRAAFFISIGTSLVAAVASLLRRRRYFYEEQVQRSAAGLGDHGPPSQSAAFGNDALVVALFVAHLWRERLHASESFTLDDPQLFEFSLTLLVLRETLGAGRQRLP